MKLRRLLFLIPVCIMIFIFMFSAQEGKESLELSNGFLYEILSKLCSLFGLENADISGLTQFFSTTVRKVAHFSIYAFLGISLYISLYFNSIKKAFVTSEAISFFYAVTDELHQHFVPGRDSNAVDILIDSLGAFSGILIIYLILQYCKNKLT